MAPGGLPIPRYPPLITRFLIETPRLEFLVTPRNNDYIAIPNRDKKAIFDSRVHAPLLANRQHDNFQFRRDLVTSPTMPSNSNNSPSAARQRDDSSSTPQREPVYWRVEGSLLNLTAVRPVGFFTWNAQTFLERWGRRGTMGVLAIARPFLYATNRVFATRLLHTVLRGVSRDRLDLLGEEFFQYFLKPRLKAAGVARLKEIIASGADVVLVSQGLDHIMRPLANHLGVERILCNRLDFRDGLATGRLLDPVIRPRGAFAKLTGRQPNGQVSREILLRSLGYHEESANRRQRNSARTAAIAASLNSRRPLCEDEWRRPQWPSLLRARFAARQKHSSDRRHGLHRQSMARKSPHRPSRKSVEFICSSGAIRPTRPSPVSAACWKNRPSLSSLQQNMATDSQLSCESELKSLKATSAALVLAWPQMCASVSPKRSTSSSTAPASQISIPTSATPSQRMSAQHAYLLDFLRDCQHASLLHLSTCYVIGQRDGRVLEELPSNYTPVGLANFDAEKEWQSLEALVHEIEARADSPEVTAELRAQALKKEHASKDLSGAALENQIRKNRVRWLRQTLTDAATQRANELGWPNTYTFTKSLSESFIRKFLDAQPDAAIAVVRPAIVETSIEKPFLGWNEGINTSASLSYLLGTFFRQLPTTESKCLDLIPVDLVCRGMTLIAAALVARRHERVYQLATSVTNPCDMRRSIELTGLGHRKFYRAQDGT